MNSQVIDDPHENDVDRSDDRSKLQTLIEDNPDVTKRAALAVGIVLVFVVLVVVVGAIMGGGSNRNVAVVEEEPEEVIPTDPQSTFDRALNNAQRRPRPPEPVVDGNPFARVEEAAVEAATSNNSFPLPEDYFVQLSTPMSINSKSRLSGNGGSSSQGNAILSGNAAGATTPRAARPTTRQQRVNSRTRSFEQARQDGDAALAKIRERQQSSRQRLEQLKAQQAKARSGS